MGKEFFDPRKKDHLSPYFICDSALIFKTNIEEYDSSPFITITNNKIDCSLSANWLNVPSVRTLTLIQDVGNALPA